jgi:CubicO group peptidase (beta-lactamase class C family)
MRSHFILRRGRPAFAAAAAAILAVAAVAGSAQTRRDWADVDRLFSEFGRPESPGCALGVFQDGRMAYERGYGVANAEHGVPIAPDSVFYAGSLSKQFTAFAVALLVSKGRVSLDDDVRKHLPEMPRYGSPITVRHLVHHTSGLRDYYALLSIAGRRSDEVFDNKEVLEIASRQKGLNFPVGDQYLYSNTGYGLLAVIVERASGMSLGRFAEQEIFKPLGMIDTHFHEDETRLVKRRADAYRRAGDSLLRP